MKNTFKKTFTLFAILFGLVACNGNNNSNNPSSNSESISLNSSENQSSSSIFEFDESTQYSSTSWDENVISMLEYSVGDVASKIPHCEAPNYLSYIESRASEDMYGHDMLLHVTRVICSDQSEHTIENYQAILEKNGFVYSMESDCYYGKASKTDCVYIFFHFFNKTGNLNLEIYRKTIRDKEWDDDVSTFIIGRKIPHIDCGAYEYYFDNYNIELYIYFVDITLNDITNFQKELVNQGFIRTSDTSEFDIYTHKNDNGIKITLNQGMDTFNDLYLMVRLENEWPLYLLLATAGSDLPRSSHGVYAGFFTNQDSNENYYTQIEYEGCEYEDYIAYCQAIQDKRNYGYTYYVEEGLENPSSYESGTETGTIYTSYFERQVDKDYVSYVDVLYSTNLKRLLIIIWA